MAIEGNTFSEEQITSILEGKRVLGPPKDLQEVENMINLFEEINHFQSTKEMHFLKAHKILMRGLLKNGGKYRSVNVGVLDGTKVKHLAPKPKMVPELIGNIFFWIKNEKELHPLILSSIVHYEIEFIHPFEDGNGRMGRFWQGLILKEYDNFFQFVPIESLIEQNQKEYYKSLELSDKSGDSTIFITFLLKVIKATLEEMAKDLIGTTQTISNRIQFAKTKFMVSFFSRKDYMELFPNISSATASRDLKQAVSDNIIDKQGEISKTKYQFN